MKALFIINENGETLRSISFAGDSGVVFVRGDEQRIEVLESTDELVEKKISFVTLATFSLAELEKGQPIDLGGFGQLVLEPSEKIIGNVPAIQENSKTWYTALTSVAVAVFAFVITVYNIPSQMPAIEEELKQHVVKIIKRSPKIEQQAFVGRKIVKEKQVKPKEIKKSVRRMGALAVLGKLNKNLKNNGGLNLNAVKTSPGPGLGGSQGSGGVQKSLYGKGILAAPLGAGANVKGAGGYGTKGRGGGQDGYGQLSLIGSTGTDSIPLGKEAIIQGGLDQDLIASVIAKNMGQVRFCYEQGLQSDPKLAGRVAVKFVIGGNGRVKTALLNSSTVQSKLVEDCILMRLRTWKFPLPEGGVEVKVSYPFLLRRLGAG